MIAEVIVNHRAKSVDKAFDYAVPQELLDKIQIGSAVIVPFGAANKPKEAYVIKLKEKSSAKKLKVIEKIISDIPLFDEKQLELINWMRNEYLVTYLDSIRAVAPSGASIKYEEWVVLENREATDRITKKLLELGGECEINRLMSMFDKNISSALKKLTDGGTVKIQFRKNRTVGDKLVRVAELTVEDEELSNILKSLEKSGAFVQAKMLDILSQCQVLSLSDMVNFTKGSYSAIRALLKKGYITTYDMHVFRDVEEVDVMPGRADVELTEEQNAVLERLCEAEETQTYTPFLLHGVTGSGKTEVYMRLIDRVIAKKKQAIVLVPEISLTPQMVTRFKNRFGKRIAIIHSGLSLGQRYDQWRRIALGEADIVVGARSAIFAPLKNIGVIILDEEHEQTYKSEMSPRYDARQVAEYRARQSDCILLFASATPLVTSYYKACTGEYELLEMKNRANSGNIPEVFVTDLRDELESGNRSVLGRRLQEEIRKNLEKGEQTILFLNRRGFSTFVSCRKCGYVAECPNCSISLKYHKFDNTLRCHYCGHTVKNYDKCPQCGSGYIRYFGGGTQKVEEEIHKLFEGASTIRMDIDTTGKKNAHAEILSRFEQEKIDILIGTQMVTKGLDFPNVTLVGVVSADTILNIDDYRSKERTFAVLEQVTGRAGRADKPGRCVVQTYSPDDSAIQLQKEHRYYDFYKGELAVRRAMWYPPFCEIVSVIFSGTNEKLTSACAKYFTKSIGSEETKTQKIQLLGPVPALVSKVKNKYIYRLLIKCENSGVLCPRLMYAQEKCRKNANYESIAIVIDKNPNSL